MMDYFETAPKTSETVRHVKSYSTFGIALIVAGSAMVGYNAGLAVNGANVNYGTLGAGVLAYGSGIYLGLQANRGIYAF